MPLKPDAGFQHTFIKLLPCLPPQQPYFEKAIGFLEEALQNANEAVRLDDSSFSALDSLGEILMLTHQWGEARRVFEKLAKMSPYSSSHLENLGVAYEKLGDLQKAQQTYKKLALIDPKNVHSQVNHKRVDGGSTSADLVGTK